MGRDSGIGGWVVSPIPIHGMKQIDPYKNGNLRTKNTDFGHNYATSVQAHHETLRLSDAGKNGDVAEGAAGDRGSNGEPRKNGDARQRPHEGQ